MSKPGEVVKDAGEGPELAWAETPAYLDLVPAEVEVQAGQWPDRLEADARNYWDTHPAFRERAMRLGHDVIADNRRLITGIGLVAALGAGAAGVIILLQHEQKRRKKR